MTPFEKAFAAARKAGKKTFTYNGSTYHTRLKGEGTSSAPKTSARPKARKETPSPRETPKRPAAPSMDKAPSIETNQGAPSADVSTSDRRGKNRGGPKEGATASKKRNLKGRNARNMR